MGLNGDDVYSSNYNLPFAFPFFGNSLFYLAVSSNGALYIPNAPSNINGPVNDAGSSVDGLNVHPMIAGIWDDLRTDRRAGDDVYVVKPDRDRIIFRWQAVTYDTPLSPTTSRGENPVSFEIELQRNGTITMRYGAGNQKLFPVVGVSGGAPDAYPIMTHTSENSFKSLANAQTIVFTPRSATQPAPQTISSLTVAPSSVVGGKSATGKVTLGSAAPSGGTVITLSDDLQATTTPASLTIPAGATSKTFTISSTAVSTAQSGTVTAKLGTATKTAPLTVQPAALSTLTLSTSSVVGGSNVTGTVTLNGPAPSTGAVVTLSDNIVSTTTPANVTIPAGATSKTFTITTKAVTASQSGAVTASYGPVKKSATLTVRPVGVLSISINPNPVTGGNTATGTVRLERAAPADITVTLTENVTAASAPTSIIVPKGYTSKTFQITTRAVTAPQSGTFTASANSVSKSAAFTVNP